MDILDKILLEWSYRCEKGYPDMDNKQDVLLLESILGELGFDINLKEAAAGTSFTETLEKSLPEGIPAVSKKYSVPTSTATLTIDSADAATFKKLYSVKPERGGGVGNGEVALFWLFNYIDPKSPTTTAQKNPNNKGADLFIEGKAVEVKAHEGGRATLGKFKEDKESRKIITTLFGLLNLTSTFTGKQDFVSEVTFNMEDLKNSFEQVIKTKKVLDDPEVKSRLGEYDIFKKLEAQVDLLLNLSEEQTPEKLAQAVMTLLVRTKLESKPGPGNYIANIPPNNPTDITFYKIPENIKDSLLNMTYKDLAENTSVNSAAIQIKYNIFK